MPLLPEFLLLNCPPMSESVTPLSGAVAALRASRPPMGDMAARRVSGLAFHSTLMTSAPSAAAKRVPPADARNHEKSKMRTPCSGKGRPRADSGACRAVRRRSAHRCTNARRARGFTVAKRHPYARPAAARGGRLPVAVAV
jgi:hypothetical protein